MPYGPAPAENRRRRNEPARGDWKPAEGVGWQHGPTPKAPQGLMKASKDAWKTWMGSWIAAHWTPEDLPGLRQLVRLYDQVERGEFQRSSELRLQMDTFGLTPKGRQDRRWKPPAKDEGTQPKSQPTSGRYGHLRDVSGA